VLTDDEIFSDRVSWGFFKNSIYTYYDRVKNKGYQIYFFRAGIDEAGLFHWWRLIFPPSGACSNHHHGQWQPAFPG